MCMTFILCILLAFVIGLLIGRLVSLKKKESFGALAGRGVINTDDTAAACRFGIASPAKMSSLGSSCCAVYHKQDGLYKPVQVVGKCCLSTDENTAECLQYDSPESS